MRGSKACAIAVRSPDRSILVEHQDLGSLYRSWLAKIPLLRGTLILWDALVLGMRALTFSANVQADEGKRLEGAPLTLTVILSLLLGVGLFFLLPAGAVYLAEILLDTHPAWSTLLEGMVRLGLLIGYLWAIGRVPEIQRVFAYHGAEHKTINAFEDGASVTVEAVKGYPREHARCGTSFLLTVVVISVVVFAGLGPLPLLTRFASRVLLIPIIAGLAYEYIRLAARLPSWPWIRVMVKPNLALQSLTTREPDADMIEVAIAAFNAMLACEETDPSKAPQVSPN